MPDPITYAKALFGVIRVAWRNRTWLRRAATQDGMLRRELEPRLPWGIAWDHRAILGLCGEGSPPVVTVVGLQTHGINHTDRPLDRLRGHWRSDVTGQRWPMLIDSIPVEDAIIPAQGKFIARAFFGDPGAGGIPVDEFLRDWGSFSMFFFEGDGHYERSFSRAAIQDIVNDFIKPQGLPVVRPHATSRRDPTP